MWRRSLSCGGRALMSPSDAVVLAWSRESRGGRTFPEPLRPFLFVLYEANLLNVDDLLPSGIDAATVRAAEEFWKEVVIAVLKARKEKDGGDDCSALERAALVAWCLTPSSVIVTRDGPSGSEAAPAEEEPVQTPRPATMGAWALAAHKAAPGVDYTPVQREDMRVQGASSLHDLVRLSVTVLMGRPIAAAEVKDMSYYSHPFDSDSYKKASKRADFPTFNSLSKAAMKSGDLRPLDEFVHKTIEGMLRDEGDSFLVANANRYMRLWLKSRSIDADEPRVGVQYLILVAEKYLCRGFPVLEDHELIRQAEKKKPSFEMALGGGLGLLRARESAPSPGASTVGSSDPGSSISAASTSRMEAILDRFAEKLETIESRVTSQGRMVEGLSSRLGRMNPGDTIPRGGGDLSNTVCHYCKQKGHVIADCPKLKALEAKRAAAPKADKTTEED